MRRLAPALLLALALAGPARAGGVGSALLAPFRYLGGRARDLLEVVELNVGLGRGFKVDLKYAIHFFGIGRVRSWRVGTMDAHAGTWREIDEELSLFPVSLAAWPVDLAAKLAGARQLAQDAHFVATAGTLGIEYLDRKELCGDLAFLLKDTVESWRHTRWGDSLPIGAEVHALVGARVMFKPLQAVDFLVGFVGVDLDPWLNKTPF